LVYAEISNSVTEGAFEQLTACETNLKMLSSALEMYSTDNSGRYPEKLSQLLPDYMYKIPICPAAGKDTYSKSYSSKINPDYYKFYCSGYNHSALSVPPNYPQFDSTRGLNRGR
jgi:hypothetical protein